MTSSRPTAVPDNESGLKPGELLFPIVGLGASTGGIEALTRFFKHVPDNSGMAFVVILHLSSTQESAVDRILQRITTMPVQQVTDNVAIKANHVYVVSPALQLMILDGHLDVAAVERPRKRQIAIDLFFRELADVHKERAFAAILSGTGSDGSVGIVRIKEQGGLTFAQLPSDAQFEDMPRHAISTGAIDFILPADAMPEKLMKIRAIASRIDLPALDDQPLRSHPTDTLDKAKAAERSLQEILQMLRTRTAYDFKHYKRATLLRRIERRMQVNGVSDMAGYQSFLHTHPEEARALLKDMLIGVTNFFRDHAAYEVLERYVVPKLFEQGRLGNRHTIRVWTPGSSTGEEAYSLAMLLLEYAETQPVGPKVQVFATDIDSDAIATARAGLYPEALITDVATSRLQKYFAKDRNLYLIKKEIRDRVLFAEHNLLHDPPFSRLHMISCRNLLIYLDRQTRNEILRMFHSSLSPGGFLFLGNSESADMADDLFTVVDKKHRIYQAKNVSVAAYAMPGDGRLRAASALGSEFVDRRKKKFSYADVHRRVLERYAPPSVIITHQSEIVHVSDHADRFLCYADGEPSHNLLSLVHPELRLELRTALVEATHSGRSVETRRIQIKRDGRAYSVKMVARPFLDEEIAGSFILVLFDEQEKSMSPELKESGEKVRDTVLTQLESELQALKIRLQNTIEQSETSAEELLSMNDDLVTVNVELKSNVAETAKIVEDLLDLSRAQTGTLTLTRTAIDIVELTRGIVVAASPLALAAEVTIEISVPGNAPIVLNADFARVEQIVWNLLNNAIKFTPPHGRVWITLCTRDGMGCIEAHDDGIGMTSESASSVFDLSGHIESPPLLQAKNGLSIGSALARQLVAAHGGRMNVDPPGESLGATFSVYLPLWATVNGAPR